MDTVAWAEERDLFQQRLDLVLYDTTSPYFESPLEGGLPIAHELFAGNTYDGNTVPGDRRRLKCEQVHLLRGLLECGVCGRACVGTGKASPRTSGGEHIYHYCGCSREGTPFPDGRQGRCPDDRLRAAGVNEAVWTTVRDLLLGSETLAGELAAWVERATTAPLDQPARIQKAKASFDTQQTILRLLMERVVVHGQHLETHLHRGPQTSPLPRLVPTRTAPHLGSEGKKAFVPAVHSIGYQRVRREAELLAGDVSRPQPTLTGWGPAVSRSSPTRRMTASSSPRP